jgi:hypothetical protein
MMGMDTLLFWVFGLVAGLLPLFAVVGLVGWWWARRSRRMARLEEVEASVPVLWAAVERLMQQNRALEMENAVISGRLASVEMKRGMRRGWSSSGSL